MARNLTWHWRWLTGLTVLTLAAGFAIPRLAPPPDLTEKRALAGFPAWPRTPGGFAAFRKGVDAYVADRFPARPYLIGGLNGLRLPARVSGSARVIVGRDGWLFYDNDTHLGAVRNDPPLAREAARGWLTALAGRSEALTARGAHYVVLVAPTKEAIYPQMAPAWFGRPDPNRPAQRLARLAAASGAGEVIYPADELTRQANWGLKVFGRYDTHWTGLGAYQAYAALMGRLQAQGLTEGPRPLTSFYEDDFPRSGDLALMLGVAGWAKEALPNFTDPPAERGAAVTWLGDRRDWTGPQVIDTGQAGKPVLLMTRDSFSNALLPFLYSHFSRLVLAHNQDGAWRQDLIDRYRPDVVVLEVVESGAPGSLKPAPPASPQAEARIADALDRGWRVPLVAAPGGAKLTGGGLSDDLRGRAGDDILDGQGGDDHIRGGRGDDLIHGGPGNDWESGDRGDDTLWGDAGADIFHSFGGAGIDRVMDFSVAEGDRVELDPGSRFQVRQVGADTVIEIEGGAQVILVGVKAASLARDTIYVSR